MERLRDLLKADGWKDFDRLETDQKKGLPQPPVQKPYPGDATILDLPDIKALRLEDVSLAHAIARRRSHRRFSSEPLTRPELSFLLWATQGVDAEAGSSNPNPAAFRTAPSAGSCHPFETYLLVKGVEGLSPGLYRYLPLSHQLCLAREGGAVLEEADFAFGPVEFLKNCAVAFIWTVLPYRTEWKYGALSDKLIALDAGHLCQNLYLACETVRAGTCAIGAYDQERLNTLVGADGEGEFVIYLAPVGKPA